MLMNEVKEAFLSPYRVLDLTEYGCLIGGKILGDLGADVIKIEPPNGSPSRNIGPFYKDSADPEKSLFWKAYNTNKRGVTIDIEKADGQQLFKQLVKSADIVLESFPVGYMDDIGLSYTNLEEINPEIILTSITPFGQDGPKAHYKMSDLTCWASGGFMYITGDPDRAPLQISFPQAMLHGGAEAASASMTALWHRIKTGEGQCVDVSIQQCVIWTTMNTTGYWECHNVDYPRAGRHLRPPTGVKLTFAGIPCKDGFVSCFLMGGGNQSMVAHMKTIVEWMDEEGMAPDWLKDFNWVVDYDIMRVTQETIDRVEESILNFFMTKTKAELYENAIQRRILLAPCSDVEDIRSNPQLEARHYWVEMDHPELNDKLTYCGPPIKDSEEQWQIKRLAPRIAEHNMEIFKDELGLSLDHIMILKQAGVI